MGRMYEEVLGARRSCSCRRSRRTVGGAQESRSRIRSWEL